VKAKTNVNATLTDAVTTSNTQVVASSPAMAMATLYNTMANNIAMANMNAVYAQQQANIMHQAVTTKLVAELFDK
jgi:hypothetical protein